MTLLVDQNPPVLKKRFFGTILIERNLITSYQLKHVLQFQEKQGGQIGRILVELGYIQERDVVMTLGIQCNVPYIAIDQYEIDQNVIQLIPKDIAYKYQVVPLDCVNRILSVVMSDPLDATAKSDLQNITNCRLVPFIATHREIEKAIHRWYGY